MQSHGQTQNLLSTDKMRLFVTFLVTLFCTGCHLQKGSLHAKFDFPQCLTTLLFDP